MRKLATIRRIAEVYPIEGADVIEVAVIDGWNSIVKKEYGLKAGGLCMYFEIDSLLPIQDRYEFLRQSSYRKFDDKEGFRLKTIRMRGEVSQGLAQPISIFPEVQADLELVSQHKMSWDELYEKDYTAALGIEKYEVAIPDEMNGTASGNYPGYLVKTGENRCQNQVRNIFVKNLGARYEVSLKMDGSSFTAFRNGEEAGVASMNWILESGIIHPFVQLYEQSNLREILRSYGKNISVQGEIMGLTGKFGSDRENLKFPQLYVFNIYDIDKSEYLNPVDRHAAFTELVKLGMDTNLIKHVPIPHTNVTLAELGITDIKSLLKFAEGPSLNHPVREGYVFKRMDGEFSFKVISNAYLLKQKD